MVADQVGGSLGGNALLYSSQCHSEFLLASCMPRLNSTLSY